MADTIDGTIQDMRALNPTDISDPILEGQIFRSRESAEPKRESIFVWDSTAYKGPLYTPPDPLAEEEVPQYIGFAPDIDNIRDGSDGVWRWMDPPRASIDAERIYGVSAKESATENAIRLQRCVDEVLVSDRTWPRPSNDPGEGDGWIVQLPAGDIVLDDQIVFNRKTAATNPACTGEKVTVAGRIIVRGQGRTTRLIYEGAPDNHAFLVGPPPSERWVQGCVTRHISGFELHDLDLWAATDADFAVLRLWQSRSKNVVENVIVIQFGNGDGINANEIIFSRFSQVDVGRQKDLDRYPNPDPSSGRGFWIHTDDAPYYISGQTVLDRVSVFGGYDPDPSQYHLFDTGILLGDNLEGEGRLLGSISAQFLNAEICGDGIVFGRGAVNIDVSVAWVESNLKAGIRFLDRAKNIGLRQIYAFQSAPRVPPTFEGDIVFGKNGGTIGENSYSGITVDGIYQNFLYGPAVRFWNTAGATNRDIRIRNIFVGEPYAGSLPPSGPDKSAGPPDPAGTEVPIATAVVELEDGTYDGLVIESIQPRNLDATLPVNTAGKRVQLIDKPELVDKIVYSGPYDVQFAYGVYETRGPTVARRGLTHTSAYTIRHNDPMYHRVDTNSGVVVITLPRIAKQNINNEGAMTPNDREGLEYHIMWIGGFGPHRVLRGEDVSGSREKIFGAPVPNGQDSVSPTANYAYVRVRAVSEPGGIPHWEIVDYVNITS